MELLDIEGYGRDVIEEVEKNRESYEKMVHILNNFIEDYKGNPDNLKSEFNRLYTKIGQLERIYIKKAFLTRTMRLMIAENKLKPNVLLSTLLQRKSRAISGITNVTLITAPYPDGQTFSCKHNCYFCPDQPGQPRSYLEEEPALKRANRHKFDSYEQCRTRLSTLEISGCIIDKIELIISGGTFTEYPETYLERFIRDAVYMCNTYYSKEPRSKLDILTEINENTSAEVKIIGITIETRPDAIDVEWITRLRRWGITRIQLGVQHTNDALLKKVNRGHSLKVSMDAFRLLKDTGFKIDIHLMPDLPGATPEDDRKMFDRVYSEPDLSVDQIKIYPCQTTPWTVIKKWHDTGKYIPYSETLGQDSLQNVITYAMLMCPPWIRIPRVVRDIPMTYVSGGCNRPNLRQKINDQLVLCNDIRFREAGRHLGYNSSKSKIVYRKYDANGGIEHFISFESSNRRVLFGLIRLRLTTACSQFTCLHNKGLIRELHIYGQVVKTGKKSTGNNVQHKGLGTTLLRKAEWVAWRNGYNGLAIISGIGVTNYYKKRGYHYSGTYDGSYYIKKFRFAWLGRIYSKLYFHWALYF